MRRAIPWIGLVFALIVPAAGLTRFLPAVPGIPQVYLREAYFWGLWLLVMGWVLLVERRPLSSIGLKRPTWRTLVYGLAGFVAVLIAATGVLWVLIGVFHQNFVVENAKDFEHLPLWFRLLLVTRAAIVEETLFRGYGIERLQELTGSPWVAGIVTFLIFVGAHAHSYGWMQLIGVCASAGVMTLLYFWRRDLLCNMAAHWFIDAIGLLFRG